jgi:hypothetical protein
VSVVCHACLWNTRRRGKVCGSRPGALHNDRQPRHTMRPRLPTETHSMTIRASSLALSTSSCCGRHIALLVVARGAQLAAQAAVLVHEGRILVTLLGLSPAACRDVAPQHTAGSAWKGATDRQTNTGQVHSRDAPVGAVLLQVLTAAPPPLLPRGRLVVRANVNPPDTCV